MRVGDALRAISGRAGEDTRAIVPLTYPNIPGSQQMSLVRTANPGEYRYDGATVRSQGFNKHPVVHACIRAVADIVASIPLVVLRERGDYESRVDSNDPLQKLLDYPAPRLTARQFRAKFAVDYLGYGNAFFQLERLGPNRPPIGLRSINAESVQQVWIDPEGDARRYDYGNWAGIIVEVPVEDILHFKDLDMGRPFQAEVFGYPRGATAIGSMLADNEATQYVRQVVTNDGTPTFAVLMNDEATTDDAANMQERYKQRIVDRGKRGTPAFFGAVRDIKPLGFTLSDLEFPDLRRVSREDICAAFGVDPRMIGIGSASNDGGLSGVQYVEARARLVQHTIEPMLSAFEDELNHWLAPEFGDVWITYDHDVMRDLVEDDISTSTRVRAEYDMGLRTWEESRRAIKLSPLPEPTDSILKTAGKDLIPAALAVIDPSEVMDAAPATDNETPMIGGDENAEEQKIADAEMVAEDAGVEIDVEDDEDDEEEEARAKADELKTGDFCSWQSSGGTARGRIERIERDGTINIPDSSFSVKGTAEDPAALIRVYEDTADGWKPSDTKVGHKFSTLRKIDPLRSEGRAEPKTDFPEQGDDQKVSLRNSQYALFPVNEAEDLKENYPEIWSKGGNIKGNEQFRKLAPIAKRGGVPDGEAEENAIRLREAWVARHRGDFQTAGVVAQIKWLAVGDRGLDHMRAVIRKEKEKLKDRNDAPIDPKMARKRGIYERAMQELDRTEQTYKATAEALFRAERPKVSKSIANASDYAEARQRVRQAYSINGDFDENWNESFTPHIAKSYGFGATEVAGVGAELAADTVESGLTKRSVASVENAIRRRAQKLAERVGGTTADEVVSVLVASERAGLTITEASRLVARAVYGEERMDVRATMIARTESAGALSQGSWDQAQEMGDVYRSKEWLAFSDKETRDTHTACMGEGSIPIDQPFESNGLMYPLDPDGDADEVINCRCVLAYSDEPA